VCVCYLQNNKIEYDIYINNYINNIYINITNIYINKHDIYYIIILFEDSVHSTILWANMNFHEIASRSLVNPQN